MENTYSENAKVFKAFCDENRLMILNFLQSGEKCACHLLDKMQISQSTLSHHMKILCESGIVKGRKEGKWTYYSISSEGSKTAIELLKKITMACPSQASKTSQSSQTSQSSKVSRASKALQAAKCSQTLKGSAESKKSEELLKCR